MTSNDIHCYFWRRTRAFPEDNVKDADRHHGDGQLPKFRSREYDREYLEQSEKQARKRRRLSRPLSPVWQVIYLIDDLISARRN
jgi:hypothetical protein